MVHDHLVAMVMVMAMAMVVVVCAVRTSAHERSG
jgi:hypothetical protein